MKTFSACLGWMNLLLVAFTAPAAEIHDAAASGSLSRIEALVKQDSSVVESADKAGDRPLHHAARAKRVEALELLLKLGADANAVGHDGWTPLHLAAKFGPTDAVMVLLNGGARADVKNSLGQTPSQVAAHDLIRRRLADSDPSMAGAKAFLDAAGKGDVEALETKLSAVPDLVKVVNADGNTALILAAKARQAGALRVLLAHGALVDAADRSGWTALHHACDQFDVAAVETLLKAGADPDGSAGEAPPPLTLAMQLIHVPKESPVAIAPLAREEVQLTPRVDPRLQGMIDAWKWALSQRRIGDSARVVPALIGALRAFNENTIEPPQDEKQARLRIASLLLDHGVDPGKSGPLGETPLSNAVISRDPMGIKWLLEKGAKPDARAPGGVSALALAVILGRQEAAQLLVAAGARIVESGPLSPLILTVMSGNEGLLRLLLNQPSVTRQVLAADVSLAAAMGGCPHSGVVRMLLDAGVDPDLAGPGGQTALHQAAVVSTPKIIGLMLAAGATLEKPDSAGFTPLHCAAEANREDNVVFLKEVGAKVNPSSHDGRTPLHSAAQAGYTGVMKRLLAAKAQVDAVEGNGGTPLIAAAFHGRADAIELLLQHGANPNHIQKGNLRPLGVVAKGGRETPLTREELAAGVRNPGRGLVEDYALCAEMLIKAGAEVEAAIGDKNAWTALGIAAENGNLAVAEVLLRHGARVDNPGRDVQGRTPLHYAAFEGHADVIRALMKAGAKDRPTAIQGGERAYAIHFAAMNNRVEAIKALLQGGANVDAKELGSGTPLMAAVLANRQEAVALLLERGANVNAVGPNGVTALFLAAEYKLTAVERLLRQAGAKQ